MTFTNITPSEVIQAGQDLSDVGRILQEGINASQEVQTLVNAHWQSPERAQKIHKALQDWNDIVPGFRQGVVNFSDFLLNVVAPTYQRLDQA